jgi:hypothetical protein
MIFMALFTAVDRGLEAVGVPPFVSLIGASCVAGGVGGGLRAGMNEPRASPRPPAAGAAPTGPRGPPGSKSL